MHQLKVTSSAPEVLTARAKHLELGRTEVEALAVLRGRHFAAMVSRHPLFVTAKTITE